VARRTKPSQLSDPLQPKRAKLRLAVLKPHPMQNEWFAPISEPELVALADSIRRDGLHHPVHVLPDNAILAGHQRVDAARVLGWEFIDCIVRTNLADDPSAAAMFVLTDNLHRRQMGPLELAKAYQALQTIERQNRPIRVAGELRMDLRDRLARHLSRSGRQLDRYLRLLELPRAVQVAISQRRLPISLAERLYGLTTGQRAEIAAALDGGEEPKAVVRRFVPNRGKQPRQPRLEHPDAEEVRVELLLLIGVFQSRVFDRYLEMLVEHRLASDGEITRLQRVRSIANAPAPLPIEPEPDELLPKRRRRSRKPELDPDLAEPASDRCPSIVGNWLDVGPAAPTPLSAIRLVAKCRKRRGSLKQLLAFAEDELAEPIDKLVDGYGEMDAITFLRPTSGLRPPDWRWQLGLKVLRSGRSKAFKRGWLAQNRRCSAALNRDCLRCHGWERACRLRRGARHN
jgi:ParB/RepB/Spo0J family partition protein